MVEEHAKHSVEVKFCGLKRRQDVEEAVRLGVEFLGFVFVPGSPRALPESEGVSLAQLKTGRARRVGVFQDQPAAFVNAMIDRCGLDLVQLHGHEPRDFPLRLDAPVLKVLRVRESSLAVQRQEHDRNGRPLDQEPEPLHDLPLRLAPNVFAALLDSESAGGQSGGLGLQIDVPSAVRLIQRLPKGTRVFLSGGLEPGNVAGLIEKLQPFAVDVSSGIESAPGKKDPQRMRAFLSAVGREV